MTAPHTSTRLLYKGRALRWQRFRRAWPHLRDLLACLAAITLWGLAVVVAGSR